MLKKPYNFSFRSSSQKSIYNIEEHLRRLDSYLDVNGCEEALAYSELKSVFFESDKLLRDIRNNFTQNVISDEYDLLSLDPDEVNPISAEFISSEEAIKIHINALPPKRIKNATGSRYEAPTYNNYLRALEKAYADSGITIKYDEKCVVIYQLNYNRKERLSDLDNFDFKQITDWLKVHFLSDDSFIYLSQIYDGNYTDNDSSLDIILKKYKDVKGVFDE